MKEKYNIFKRTCKLLAVFLLIISVNGCNSYASLDNSGVNKSNEDKLVVHYIDVGQGDSTFIELPNDEVMLIDAGENEYSEIIDNYISNLGYERIDYVIGTHPHSDHIGGMEDIINSYDIGKVYMPKASSNTKTYLNLLQSIKNKGLKIDTGKSGVNIIDEGNLKIDIIAPVKDSYDDLNNYSVVVKLAYGNNSFIFMGDAEKKVENEIMDNVKDSSYLRSDVIKVGHHGSGTSSGMDFLKAVQPKYAIVSVGKDNKYGHPHKNILEDYRDIGANIYRTDEMGNIIVTSDGKNISVNNKPYVVVEVKEEISLVSLPEDVKKGETVTIEIKGKPKTEYDIDVMYKSGASTAKGLENKVSDDDGNVSWTFKVSNNVTIGNYKIIIKSDTFEKEYSFSVLED